MKKFDIILCDPPWAYDGTNNLAKSSCVTGKEDQVYDTTYSTNLNDVGEHLQRVCADRSLLYMWVTGPIMQQGLNLMKSWGWDFATIAFVWEKERTNPGYYTLSSTEFIIVGKRGGIPNNTKGSVPRYRGCSHRVRQFQQTPRLGHSEKPELFHELIETMHPATNKLELFARRHRKGWTCLGNALSGNDIRKDLDDLEVSK